MKSYKFVTFICAIVLVIEHLKLRTNVIGMKTPEYGFKREQMSHHSSSKSSVVVKNKDRYSQSASTLIPSLAVAASSSTSAAQVSRRNNDLWYLEQSVVSYL